MSEMTRYLDMGDNDIGIEGTEKIAQ